MDNWFLFPTSIAIATVATASGIGGAIFFAPIFLLVLGLEPIVAFGAALLTQLFGLSSGLLVYVRARLVDFRLGGSLLMFSLLASVLGVMLADRVPQEALKGVFGLVLVLISVQMFRAWRQDRAPGSLEVGPGDGDGHESVLIDARGCEYRYTAGNKSLGACFAGVGGALLGMISVGLAELQEYNLVARCRVPPPVAIGTSIFVVVITVIVASAGRVYGLLTMDGPEPLDQVLGVVTFTIPGVLIGGQIGPRIQARLKQHVVKIGLAVIFAIVGLLMLAIVGFSAGSAG